ncbi:MAG: hypothetical protein PHV88_07690, partial [Eubacteriales bacterium]|nr:hypothetical protein [Eubacteriales bacterium]
AYTASALLQETDRPETKGRRSGSGLNTAWYLRFSVGNFRARKRKMVSVLLVTIMALICSAMVLGLYSGFQGLFGEINKDILDSDKIIVRNYGDGLFRTMDSDYLERLSETGDYAKLLPWYECKINISAVGRTVETRITVCDGSEFMENRIQIVKGENISKENEIIIEEKTAREVFGETDCISHEIIVSDDTGYSRVCYVSGVYRSNNEINSGTTIISKELNTELASGTTEADFIFTYPESLTENRTVCRFEAIKEPESGAVEDIRHGKLMVNSSGFNEILRLVKPGHAPVSQGDLSAGNVPADVFDAVIGRTMIFQRLDMTVFARMEISGIFTEEDPSGSLVFLVSREDADMMSAPLINRADLYLKDFSAGGRQAAAEKLKDAGISYELASDRIGAQVMVKMSVINVIIVVVSVVIVFLSLILCNFSAKINIIDRTYDIGVLKSLGASGSVIFRIFASDTLLMGSFAGFTACAVVCMAWLTGMTDLFVIEGATVWQFRAWHLLPVIVTGTLLPLFAGIREIMTVSKMTIMDAVKR